MVSEFDGSGRLTIADVLATAFPRVGREASADLRDLPVHVIPQGGEPRWVVLGDSSSAVPVFRSWRPFKISTRLRWSAVIAASSMGALARLPGVVTSRAGVDFSYWRQSFPGFEEDWLPVVHVGNPSHTRKITVFFVGRRDHRFKAVAKVPLLADSRQAILNEADILQQLRGADYLPGCLFQDRAHGIAAQTWLEGEPVSRALTPAHMDLLARFALPDATMRVADRRASIAAGLQGADLPFDRDVLSRGMEFLEDDRPLPAFIEHRDFAPWNLKRLAGGRTGAVDWEWTVCRSLPCQDVFRYFYIQDALFNGPGDVWQTLNGHPLVQAHYRRFAIAPEALPALTMHYLLRVLAMDWKSGNTFLAQYSFGQVGELLRVVQGRKVKG